MADIIFPTVTGNALITSLAISASTIPARYIVVTETAAVTSLAISADTDPVLHIAEAGIATITGEAAGDASQAIYINGSGTVTITGEATSSWQRWIYCAGNALITAGMVYANRYVLSAELSLTLLPGESVIVDSERYNVWKDGESIIGSHFGAWFDDLTTETPSIDVKANTSTIQAEISYIPRYL